MKDFKFWIALCFTLGFVAIVPCAQSDIYRYVDPNGVVHFTNTPTSPKFKFFMKERKRKPLERERSKVFDRAILEASRRHGVDTPLVLALIKVESDFDPVAISNKGARGLMQLMPETARILGVNNCFNPLDNIEGGVRHLRTLLDTFDGSLPLALAAYNAGRDAVVQHGGIPPYPETRQYVQKVMKYYTYYRANGWR